MLQYRMVSSFDILYRKLGFTFIPYYLQLTLQRLRKLYVRISVDVFVLSAMFIDVCLPLSYLQLHMHTAFWIDSMI